VHVHQQWHIVPIFTVLHDEEKRSLLQVVPELRSGNDAAMSDALRAVARLQRRRGHDVRAPPEGEARAVVRVARQERKRELRVRRDDRDLAQIAQDVGAVRRPRALDRQRQLRAAPLPVVGLLLQDATQGSWALRIVHNARS
jgi:hypothetical protein